MADTRLIHNREYTLVLLQNSPYCAFTEKVVIVRFALQLYSSKPSALTKRSHHQLKIQGILFTVSVSEI
jgi:hypothetical protein